MVLLPYLTLLQLICTSISNPQAQVYIKCPYAGICTQLGEKQSYMVEGQGDRNKEQRIK